MSPMMDDSPQAAGHSSFLLMQHGHRDMAEATAFNSQGNRFATGAVDGKIKVYNRHKDGSWNLCDTWGAHTAEILQIQWLPQTIHPNLIASIGTDGKFKLWVEDPTIQVGRGRRFNSHQNKPLWELTSRSRAPFLSFSIKFNPDTRHIYLVLIDRKAVLTLYENEEPENLENWTEVDGVNVCEKPPRGEESSFKVAFDPNVEPCYMAVRGGVQRDSLGVVVASMNRVSIWRTKEISHTVSLGSASTKEFYLAADLRGHRGLVRDVAWAPGNIRGFDIVATACKDGFVRVFEVQTRDKSRSKSRSKDFARTPERQVVQQRSAENGERNAPSGIGAGLAGARSGLSGNREYHGREGEVIHTADLVSKLDTNREPVWQVSFDADGQLLGSVADDGKLMLWRREPSGMWSKSAELAMLRTVIS